MLFEKGPAQRFVRVQVWKSHMNLCKRSDSEARLYKLVIELGLTSLNHPSTRTKTHFVRVMLV